MQWLVCPACGAAGLDLEVTRSEAVRHWHGQVPPGTPGFDAETSTLQEIVEGTITCRACHRGYPIADGIPRMVLDEAQVAASAHAKTHFDADVPEWEAAFLDFADPLGPSDFVGRLVLDVGCGFGRGAFFAAKYGAEVVAMDVDPEVVATCRDNTKEFPRVHAVQADARHLPVGHALFDVVYAFGLLHHLNEADADRVFHECTLRVKQNGRFSVWVYGKRQGAAAAFSALLRGMTHEMPSEELLNVSRVIATVLRVGSHWPYRVLRHVPLMKPLATRLPLHDHWRWPYDIVAADVFDRLRVPVTRTFTREDLEARYVREGYLDVFASRRIRNNESFRATGVRR